MSSLFHEIENNEAILLLYLAGELSVEDRAEVEQMLSSDGGLRMELEEIRSSLADSMATLSTLDAMEPMSASSEAATLRRVSREMKQWQVDRIMAKPVAPQKKRLRYPAWVYPTTAVASLLIGSLVWWGITGISSTEIAATQEVEPSRQTAERLAHSLSADSADLADAEMQANSLVARTDDPTASISIQGDSAQ